MDTTEVGAYTLLLCKAWLEEPPGSIPADDAILARWARLDAGTWSKCKARVLSPFTLETTSNRYFQKRMQEEYRKLMKLYRDRSRGGRAGANSRWEKERQRKANANMAEPSVSYAPANGKNMAPGSVCVSLSSSDSLNPEEITQPGVGGAGEGVSHRSAMTEPFRHKGLAIDALDPDFDRFWRAYPKKKAQMEARRAWDQLNPDKDLAETILRALAEQTQSEQWRRGVIPNAATWLNGCRWQDEMGQPGQRAQESVDDLIERERRRRADLSCNEPGTSG